LLYLQTSQQKTIRSVNPLIMVGLFVGLLVIRTTAFWLFPGLFTNWDLLLPFMLYFGQRRPLFEGLLLWFILSHLYSLQSVAPMGVFVVYYLILFVIARLISEVFFATEGIQILGLISLLTLFSRFVLPLVARAFDSGWPVWSWRNLHLGMIITNIFVGWICYQILGFVDKITFKDPRQILDLGEGLA
jgi:hypothetical protein